ncbi:hypothetical protein RclHR1_04730018 [Rhizophagus clarus]|uniref:Protein kinase domain-containing protein n=1 Tax=Rhizophagus clarus TaxID=94130 RepID=A0A2Z6SCH3_9GLOM|nr:hypothetical protein RclHR1_04730018 [Rhizophagus clarus]
MNNNNVNNFYEYELLTQRYGLCTECKQPNTSEKWCKECNSKRLQQNFGNWTSGNEYVDKFIQESQLKARSYNELLEWVPYTQLRNIQYFAKGGFSTIYSGIWLDGHIDYWNYEKQDWNRRVYKLEEKFHEEANNPNIKNPLESNIEYGRPIVLKSLDYSSDINEDFLNEWKVHLQCQYEVRSNGAFLIPIFGIT